MIESKRFMSEFFLVLLVYKEDMVLFFNNFF